MRVRCHLGLEVPDGCGIRVGGLTARWEEGRCLVLDDSFPHEVWNDGGARRVVLVLDLWHPDLSEDEVALLAGLERHAAAHAPRPVRAAAPPREADPFAALRRAIAENPGDARLHLTLGHELATRGRYAEAEASARAVLAIDPTHAMAHNNLGWVRQMQGDTPGAIAAYERALELDPACGRARRNLASLFTGLGRYAEALELRRADLAADPASAPALGEVVGAALRAGELELAAEHAVTRAAVCRGTRWYPVRRTDDPELPASVPWDRVLTPSKLDHDIEQLEYLQGRGVLGDEVTPVIAAYDDMLDTLRPLGPNARVPLVGPARASIGHVYNRIVHARETPRVARALSDAWDPARVEEEFVAGKPRAVVVDRFLSDEAIESLRSFCLESTVWSENRYNHGRLGSMFQDGFNCPLLVQIAEEVRAALPRVLTPDIPVRQIWGYKYASTAPAETPHADFAFVNVNLWITPDEANLDPETGGLVFYDVYSPPDWDHATYNSNIGVKIRELLQAQDARPRHVPYRYNRAVIFDSAIFHATPSLTFAPGYENRRMNVTWLCGARDGR
jgi:tetratricopeptide (TPR) repeat protein